MSTDRRRTLSHIAQRNANSLAAALNLVQTEEPRTVEELHQDFARIAALKSEALGDAWIRSLLDEEIDTLLREACAAELRAGKTYPEIEEADRQWLKAAEVFSDDLWEAWQSAYPWRD